MNKLVTIGVATLFAAHARTATADDTAKAYDFWLDSNLHPHPQNPKDDIYVDGDTLTVHVDTTRLFPIAKDLDELGFAATAAPPATKGLYVVGYGSGVTSPIFLQSGGCPAALGTALKTLADKSKALDEALRHTDQTAIDAAKAAVKAATDVVKTARIQTALTQPSYICNVDPDWPVTDGFEGYVCGTKTLKDIATQSSTWSIVQKVDATYSCESAYTLALGQAITAVRAAVSNGAEAPQDVAFSQKDGVFSTSIPIKANTRSIVLSVTNEDNTVSTTTITIKASARSAYSPVRVQAEVLTTNRARVISLAVSVSPMAKKYFTEGPQGCFWGCRATGVALLRLGGDNQTVAQFGLGAAANLVAGFQLNAGWMFGSTDTNSAWRYNRTWFVGLAIDPVILADVASQGSSTKK
jgi:hypothetical protein